MFFAMPAASNPIEVVDLMDVQAPLVSMNRLQALWQRPEIRDTVLDNLIWLILVLALVVFSFIPSYFTGPVLISIVLHSTFLAVLVIGETVCLLTGNFDLSVESVLAFSAMCAAVLMGTGPPTPGWGISPVVALPAMLAMGALIGALNGLCVTKLKINPFIVTLATMIIFRGLTVVFTMAQAVIRLPALYIKVAKVTVGPIPLTVLLTMGLYAFFHFLTSRTLFGRKLYAVGGDRDVSFALGLEPDKVIVEGFALSGLMAATAGWFLSARVDAAVPRMAEGMTFDVMAAAVIGGVSLKGGKGSLVGALGGVLLLGAINAALTLVGVSPYWYQIVRGIVIFIAVGLDALKQRLH